ncbi:MAG: radical SAM protein [Chloroflexi bacterium]|nr:radical SAM protein [Chloroflexota bacterium]
MELGLVSYFDTLPRDSIYSIPSSLKVKRLDGRYIVANTDTGGWVAVTEEILPLVFSRQTQLSEELYRRGLYLCDGVPIFNHSHPAYEGLYLFEFSVTPDCNLSCVYCANQRAGTNGQSKATPELGELFINRVVEYIQTRQVKTNLTIEFTGGEPLLNFPVIKHTIDYAKDIWAPLNLPPIDFSIVTNGTLVDDELIALILEYGAETVGISVSVDGTAMVHNVQRRFPSAKGSFDKAVTNLRRLQSAGIPVTGTISVVTSHSQTELAAMARSLIELGFRQFLFSPAAPIGRAAGSLLVLRFRNKPTMIKRRAGVLCKSSDTDVPNADCTCE